MSPNQHVRVVREGRRAGQRDVQSINVTINQSHEHRRHNSVAASSLVHRLVCLPQPKQRFRCYCGQNPSSLSGPQVETLALQV